VLLIATGLLLAPASLAGSVAMFAVALTIAGISIAPMNVNAMGLLAESVPADRQSEGFAYYSMAIQLGFGVAGGLTALLLSSVGSAGAQAAGAGLLVVTGLATAAWRAGIGRRPGYNQA
jgi:MFS family permease